MVVVFDDPRFAMSTRLYFSSRNGLLSRDDKKPNHIRKSVAELDLLLDGVDAKQLSRPDEADEDKSTGTPTSVASFPIQEHPHGSFDKFVTKQPMVAVPSRSTHKTLPSSSSRQQEYDDSKSVSSSTIVSRDMSFVSQELIANMEHVKDSSTDEYDGGAASSGTTRSHRSKSCSSSRRTKRGDSLERDISRTVLEQTPDILRYVEEPDFKSAEEILEDLMTTMLSSSGHQRTPNAPLKNNTKADLPETASRVDQDNDVGGTPFDETLDTTKHSHDTAVLSDNKGLPTECLQTDASDSNRDPVLDGVESGEDVFDGLMSKESGDLANEGKSAENNESIYSAGMVDFNTETIPEKSEWSLVESLTASSQMLVAPLLQLQLQTPSEEQSDDTLDNTNNQVHLPVQQQDEVKADVLHTDLLSIDNDSTIENDWTNFGGDSAFGHSFSPEKTQEPSEAIGTPTETKQPVSSELVVDLPEGTTPPCNLNPDPPVDLDLEPLPEEGFNWGTAFPTIDLSDSGLEEVCTRFSL